MIVIQISQFMTWQALATFGGATAATAILTQLFKGLTDKLPFHVPTRLLSYVFALAVLVCATAFTGGGHLGEYVICFINAAVVSLSSNGAYDLLAKVGGNSTGTDGDDGNDTGDIK